MRVLIATITAGAGHLQAAAAVEEAWRGLRPDDLVERVDLLDFVSRLHRKVYATGYVKLVEHAPELWGMVFKKTDNAGLVRKLTAFRRRYARLTNPRFAKYLRSFQPDVVICTHFTPLEVVGEAKQNGPKPFAVCVVTDFEAHALWMEQTVDLYCVAAEETKASLVARGALPHQVAVTGIPIAQKFSAPPNPALLRKQHGLRDDLPVLLILGGGFGMGPVAEILATLDRVESPLCAMVVAGRNEALRRELAARDYRHPTRVLGFVSNMHELMAMSDLILTKPGGLTTSEALALGKPLFILNPIPGQEAANSDFLLEKGVATKVNRVEDVPFRLSQLLGSKKLAAMAKAAKALGQAQAAANACREMIRRMT